MLQKQLKLGFIVVLTISITLSCKKENDSTLPMPITPKSLGLIPMQGGVFIMGSLPGVWASNIEYPQHAVKLDAFYLDSTELTRKAFIPFLKSKDTNYLAVNQRKVVDYTNMDWDETDEHPICNVSWYTAIAYCNWLTKKTGSTDTCYTFTLNPDDGTIKTVTYHKIRKGYRLPTEAEWEYACRAGNNGNFCFGEYNEDSLKAYAWYSENSDKITHPVGHKKPNRFGLYDMHGNVSEWVWDLLPDNQPYYPDIAENPVGPTAGKYHILRGGGWDNSVFGWFAGEWRSASRQYISDPELPNRLRGFRIAKSMN